MPVFVVLKRPGPPTREVLVNVDEILMVQPGQGTGSAILFGREHLVSFEEDFATVIKRIQSGPYIQTAHAWGEIAIRPDRAGFSSRACAGPERAPAIHGNTG